MHRIEPIDSTFAVHQPALQLRRRAAARLSDDAADPASSSPADALRVLFELASTSATAPQAQALLHELQVHQVELELQAEELRSSRLALEELLSAQSSRYENAPVGCYSVDPHTVLRDMNRTGARMLGQERGALIGKRLDSFIAPTSLGRLQALLAAASRPLQTPGCALALRPQGHAGRSVHAVASAEPDGSGWQVAFSAMSSVP